LHRNGYDQFLAVQCTQIDPFGAQQPPRVFHMYRREHRDQLSFKDFFLPFGGQLSGDNRWIKLADLIR